MSSTAPHILEKDIRIGKVKLPVEYGPIKSVARGNLGGGALITYLSGKPMPGVEALKKAAQKVAR